MYSLLLLMLLVFSKRFSVSCFYYALTFKAIYSYMKFDVYYK